MKEELEKYKEEAQANKNYMVQVPIFHHFTFQKIMLTDLKMFICTEKVKENLKPPTAITLESW